MTDTLGRWAVIDIETSGADPSEDSIIDIGYLQYEGTTLVRKYQSLVRYEYGLSEFIKKLTGISDEMVKKAPRWLDVRGEVEELCGHHLLAHNADFERSFLGTTFDRISDEDDRESYEDSLPFLALLFPRWSSLKLENFICRWGIADEELHRGFQDSVDLLKVLIIAVHLVRDDIEWNNTLSSLIAKYNLSDWWYAKFFHLSHEELEELARSVDLDIEAVLPIAREFNIDEEIEGDSDYGEKIFDLEFSGKNIGEILMAEDKVKEKVGKYRYRSSQKDLALKVGQSFKNNVHSIVQAPTGTGKTLGYLLPSALYTMDENQQVLIATGTKTLQHQAMYKDVPQLRKILSLDKSELRVSKLVGSSNHYCELLYRQNNEGEDLLSKTKFFDEKFANLYIDAIFHANSNLPVDKGISRLNFPYVLKRKFKELDKLDKELAVDFRACTGSRCPFSESCTYHQGLRKAKEAHLVIGNHSLMFSWPRGFPRPSHIVVDEAHKIEEETTKAFTLEVTGSDLESFSQQLLHFQGIGSLFYLLAQKEEEEGASTAVIQKIREDTISSQRMLSDQLVGLSDAFELFFKKKPRYTSLYWNEHPMQSVKSIRDPQEKSIYNRLDSIKNILKIYYEGLLVHWGKWEVAHMEGDAQVMAFSRFEAFIGHLEDIMTALSTSLEDRPDYSRSLKFHEDIDFVVLAAPINIGKFLHEGLLETSASVVFTSATLGNATGDRGTKGIEWATGYSYLKPEKRFKSGFFLPSQYDYKNRTKVFVCDDTPALYDQKFVPTVLEKVCALIRNLQGRSLLLFSAKTRFEAAREYLLSEFDGELPVFIQGMGQNVVDEFKNSGQGLLLGMETFGEGIDIPGDALQFVFVDKIPDLRMDKVIQDRRDFFERNLGNEFSDYYLAHRTRGLQQKLGRLLRTENDLGGVIVVDSRIKKWKGRTLEQFYKLMEPYDIHRAGIDEACSSIEEFISSHD